jgi:hypothetical protein
LIPNSLIVFLMENQYSLIRGLVGEYGTEFPVLGHMGEVVTKSGLEEKLKAALNHGLLPAAQWI